MLLISQDTDLEAVARNVTQPVKQQFHPALLIWYFYPWIRMRAVLRILDPASEIGRKSGSGTRIRIRDEQPESYFRELGNNFLGLNYNS
jgi:hypothetical protein